jgi:hypothetical protein
VDRVHVYRGHVEDRVLLLGPLPGLRDGDTLAYEFQLPERFVAWPGRSRLERIFVLLDLGVSMSAPCWQWMRADDGTVVAGPDADRAAPATWYVDLVTVSTTADAIVVRDLYADVMVPEDGRHQRILDLDEYADAMEDGRLDLAAAVDGLRRWQRFFDMHLHSDRDPRERWSDFPPQRLRALAALPAPLGPIITASD